MKKEELKNSIEKIEISNLEKQKIYNNIMKNRKKKKSFWPILTIGALATASLVLFFSINNKSILKPNDKAATGTLALENEYKKEVIINVKDYLNANNIEVQDELIVDSKEIINNDKYNVCNGNVIIRKYNEDLTYVTDISCGDYDKSGSVEFRVWDGFIRNVFEIQDEIVITTYENYKDLNGYTQADANIIFLDEFAQIKGNFMLKNIEDIKQTIDILSVNKIKDNYFITYRIREAISSNTFIETDCYVILDKEFDPIEEPEFLKYENKNIIIDKLIKEENNTLYFTANYSDENKNHFIILCVDENGQKAIEYEGFQDDKVLERGTSYKVTAYSDNYFYGYAYTKGYVEDYYNGKTIFKLDNLGNIVWKKGIEISIQNEENYDVTNVYINNNRMYVIYKGNNEKDAEYIIIYDLYGNYIKSIRVEELNKKNPFVIDIHFEEENIIIELQGYDSSTSYAFITTDRDLNIKSTKEVTKKPIENNFEWSALIYRRLKNNGINMIYAVNEKLDSNNSILLAFYK